MKVACDGITSDVPKVGPYSPPQWLIDTTREIRGLDKDRGVVQTLYHCTPSGSTCGCADTGAVEN